MVAEVPELWVWIFDYSLARFMLRHVTPAFNLAPNHACGSAVYIVTPTQLVSYAIVIPTNNETVFDQIMLPIDAAVRPLDVDVGNTRSTHEGFVDFFDAYFAAALAATPQAQITAGRMLPRSLMENLATAAKVSRAFKAATDRGFTVSCAAVNAGRETPLHTNSVFPLWRTALLHCILTATWDFDIPCAQMVARQEELTNDVMPLIEAATPGGGAYLNEANFQQKDWQNNFYGSNYGRLQSIKQKYDANGVFYSRTAVGSEKWKEDSDGRLCQV